MLFVLHHGLNRRWFLALGKGRYPARRVFQDGLDLLLLAFMILQPLSGILMSKPKEDVRRIKAEIGSFLTQKLHLELSEEKTLVTKSTHRARFLGYDVRTTPYTNLTRKTARGCYARNYGGHVQLEVPTELVKKKLLDLGAMEICVQNGVEIWHPIHRKSLIARDNLSILDQFNGEVRGLCNYYSIANNRSKLHSFRYVMKYSMVRTYCCKYRCTKGKIFRTYYRNGVFGVNYVDKQGNQKLRAFWSESLKRETHSQGASVNLIHKPKGILKRAVLAERLRRGYCEWCGKQTQELEVQSCTESEQTPRLERPEDSGELQPYPVGKDSKSESNEHELQLPDGKPLAQFG